MIALYQAEHFSNRRSLRIGEVKQQSVHKTTKRELRQLKEAQICLTCTCENCPKGHCDKLKDMGSQGKYKKVGGEKE